MAIRVGHTCLPWEDCFICGELATKRNPVRLVSDGSQTQVWEEGDRRLVAIFFDREEALFFQATWNKREP